MKESYYKRNTDKVKARALAYYHKNAEKRKQDFKLRELRLKGTVTAHYGGGQSRCVLCEESRLGALHIDHVDGGGKQHRKAIRKKGGGAFYNWLIKNNFPGGYRTLCANCNWLSYLEVNGAKLSTSPAAIAARQRTARHKPIVVSRLGGRCATCPIADIRLLTVHHTNHDGAEHRRRIAKGQGGHPFYIRLLESDDFTGLELRCFSCNDAEAYER